MKLSARDQMIVAGILIGIVAVAFIALLIVPQFGKLSQLDTDMRTAESEIAKANQLLAARQEAKQKAAQTQAQLTRLANQIPDAPEMAALIIELQDTANDAGVEWERFSPQKPADAAGFQTMPLDFAVNGRWDDVMDYLRRLSELERAVRVISVNVTRPIVATESTGTAGGQAQLAAQVKIEVYSLPRTGGAGGAAPAAPQ